MACLVRRDAAWAYQVRRDRQEAGVIELGGIPL